MFVIEALEQIGIWHWWGLGFFILMIEALGAGGFLLGIGCAALFNGLLLAIFSQLSWGYQLLIFTVNALIFSYGYWRLFKQQQKTPRPNLNNRTATLIGRRVVLHETIQQQGHIRISDTLWKAQSDKPLERGTEVEVISATGSVLSIRRTAEC